MGVPAVNAVVLSLVQYMVRLAAIHAWNVALAAAVNAAAPLGVQSEALFAAMRIVLLQWIEVALLAWQLAAPAAGLALAIVDPQALVRLAAIFSELSKLDDGFPTEGARALANIAAGAAISFASPISRGRLPVRATAVRELRRITPEAEVIVANVCLVRYIHDMVPHRWPVHMEHVALALVLDA